MGFLIEKFWVPMLIAALLGVCIGWVTCRRTESSWSSSWLPFAIAAFVTGTFAALQIGLPGRPGLWLESALLMFASYIVGCCIGCALRALMLGSDDVAVLPAGLPDDPMTLAAVSAIATGAVALNRDPTSEAVAVAPAPAPAQSAKVVAATTTMPDKTQAHSDADARAAAAGVKPPLLLAPRAGKKDDLTLIWGVADRLEERMNHMGIWHFDQIAKWSADEIKWFESTVEGFKGRIERDKWIEQCKKLAAGWRPERNLGERPKS